MINNKEHIKTWRTTDLLMSKVGDYMELMKFKLNFLVVITSLLAFMMATNGQFQLSQLVVLFIGGLLISGASGAMNELLEIDQDAQMKRTRLRPLPDRRMSATEGWVVSIVSLLIGLVVLYLQFNFLTVVLSLLVVILYAWVYTPLKRKTPLSVLVGAIPGALPPVLGVAAAIGRIDSLALFLFFVQFLWQFPHFWSVAYMAKEDYAKAGFKMIPNGAVESRFMAIQCVIYSAILMLLSPVAVWYGAGSWLTFLGMGIAGLLFTLKAINFFKKYDYKSARELMFASILYLPVVFIIIYLDFIIQ